MVRRRRIARPRSEPALRSFRKNQPADASVADNEDFARLDAAAAHQLASPIPGRRRALAMEEDYALEFLQEDHLRKNTNLVQRTYNEDGALRRRFVTKKDIIEREYDHALISGARWPRGISMIVRLSPSATALA